MMNQLKQLCFMMNKSREQNPELFEERHGSQMCVRMRDTPYTRGEIAFGGWNSKDDQDHGKHAFKGEDEESDDEDEDDFGWCNEDCEKAEGCIECNPMAFCSAETFAKWQDDCVSRMKTQNK